MRASCILAHRGGNKYGVKIDVMDHVYRVYPGAISHIYSLPHILPLSLYLYYAFISTDVVRSKYRMLQVLSGVYVVVSTYCKVRT